MDHTTSRILRASKRKGFERTAPVCGRINRIEMESGKRRETCCGEETRAWAAKSALGWTRLWSSDAGSGSPSTVAAHGAACRGLAAATARRSLAPMAELHRSGDRDDDGASAGAWSGIAGWARAELQQQRAVVAYMYWAIDGLAA